MLDRCLASCQDHLFQRPMCHAKVPLICLFVTAIVLLGTIGAGKFGTQEQHFNYLRNNFYSSRKHAEPQKVVIELTRNSSSDHMNTKNDDPILQIYFRKELGKYAQAVDRFSSSGRPVQFLSSKRLTSSPSSPISERLVTCADKEAISVSHGAFSYCNSIRIKSVIDV